MTASLLLQWFDILCMTSECMAVVLVHQATLANSMGLFGGALCSGAPQTVPALLARSIRWTWLAESLDKTLDHKLLYMSISIVLSNYYVSCEKFEPNNSWSSL